MKKVLLFIAVLFTNFIYAQTINVTSPNGGENWAGCSVRTTDLPRVVAETEVVHERYQDLARVEQAFRTCKTAPLAVRPV